MPALTRIKSTLRSLFRKEELDLDLDDELQNYLDELADEKIRAGMSPEKARRQARIELGGVEQVKERVRQNRLGASLDVLAQDLRLTFRVLGKNPGFAAVAILTLAIGIGATTALFSTVNAVLLQALPFEEPDQLVLGRKTINGQQGGAVSRLDYFDYRERCRSFENLAALTGMRGILTGGSEPRRVRGAYVTWNLFPTLRVSPAAGRLFLPPDEKGEAPVVVISHALWQSLFAGSPDAVGGAIKLDGRPLTVVGVMPRGFRFFFDADLWLPVTVDGPYDLQRDSHSHLVVGRLGPGVTMQQAQSEVDAFSAVLEEQYPATNAAKGLRLDGLHDSFVENVRTSLLMLMATTVLVLLIACGNVAGLLMARGQRRLPELALRSALGAARGRLIRQLLSESILLAAVAGLAGVGLAYVLQGLVLRLLPVGRLGIDGAGIDGRSLLFALAVTVVTSLIVGVLPAWKSTAVNLAQRIGTGQRNSSGVPSTRLRNAMVALQVAIAVVLLVGTGLLVRSLGHLAGAELGFDPDNLFTGAVQIQYGKYPDAEQQNLFFTSLLEEVKALPGVDSASLVNKLPILDPWMDWSIWPAEQPQATIQDQVSVMARWVRPGYFETMRIPLIRGRDIAATDVAGTPQVVVISEQTARDLFGDQDPVGRPVKIGWDDEAFEIVGVVGDARLNELREASPAMYMSNAQMPSTWMRLVVRTSTDPMNVAEPIRRLLRQKDPDALLSQPITMHAILDEDLGEYRIVTLSLSLFAGVALLLTGIGLYAMLAYHVSQRYHEIGIRMAMGAAASDVFAVVTRKGLVLVGKGLLLGLAAAYPGTLLIRQLLFEIRLLDLATYASALLFLVTVSLLACALPTWRALRINPVEVLKKE